MPYPESVTQPAAPEANKPRLLAVINCFTCLNDRDVERCDTCIGEGVLYVPLCLQCLGVPPRYLPLTDLADGHEACRC